MTVRDDDGGEALGTVRVTVLDADVAFRRGDLDGDGTAALTDAVILLEALFIGGRGARDCPAAADADGDGALSLADAIGILGHLFLGRPPPAEPSAACGRDPMPDGLGCRSHPYCGEE